MLTLHHLDFSRSTRVLWLLEELGLEYELVRYTRDETMRAPPSLLEVHPLGKAPVLQDDTLTLAESASILTYLNERYGDGRFAPPVGTADAAIHDEWLHYVESSAASPIVTTLIGGMTGGLPEGLGAFVRRNVARTLDYIAAGVTPGPFLMGEHLSLADIQMSYILASAGNAGMLDAHPALGAYLERLYARPALAKAIEIGGPMTFPK